MFAVVAEASANMIVDYPEEILIESGWMGYANCIINNSGDADLHNVVISIGGSPNWFEFQKNTTDVISPNSTTEFIAKIYVPSEYSIGDYNFALEIKSYEVNFSKDFVVKVFGSRDNLLLYQIKNLRNNLSTLEEQTNKIGSTGKDVTFVRGIIDQIGSELNLTEGYVADKLYSNATESIKNAENLFIKANFELSNPSKIEEKPFLNSISSNDIMLFSLSGIALLAIALVFFAGKLKLNNRVRIPNLKVKEVVVDNKKINELEQEIGKIKESQGMIEGEYKDNVISKDSYDELKSRYQQKLAQLESDIKKLRGY